MNAFMQVINHVVTDLSANFTTGDPVPTIPVTEPPDGLSRKITTLLGWMKWGALLAAVAGLIICAVMMILGRRGRSQTAVEGAVGIPWVLAGVALISAAVWIVNTVVTS